MSDSFKSQTLNGSVYYFNKYNFYDREDGPAVIDTEGNKYWYRNGERHCDNGPAVEYANGDKEWWLNGKLHREGGPAVEFKDNGNEWWVNGKLHREDGPAIEYPDGHKAYYIEGRHLTEKEYNMYNEKKNSQQDLQKQIDSLTIDLKAEKDRSDFLDSRCQRLEEENRNLNRILDSIRQLTNF